MRAALLTLVVVILVAVGAALAFMYSGLYNIAATDPHFDPVGWALDTTFENSVTRRAEDIAVPAFDESMVRDGAGHYAAMCAQCHGTPGAPLPEMARHMRPQPPELSQAAMEWAPNEVFWIVKHGVKMTGMPAWGPQHKDERLWSIVAFVEQLPQLSAEQYQQMVAPAKQQEAGAGATGEGPKHQHEHGTGSPVASDETASAQATGAASTAASASGTPTATAAEPAVTVHMTDALKFEPARITISAGDTVKWTNPSNLRHTVTADPDKAAKAEYVDLPADAETFDSRFIEPGGSYSHRFTVPGHYKYFCIPHQSAGMIGEILVEE